MDYLYHIEDGQFPRDIISKQLLGQPGDEIEIEHEGVIVKAYILDIDGKLIHCLGNTNQSFPKNRKEHFEAIKALKGFELLDFQISFFDENQQLSDSHIVVSASDEQNAREVFREEYPHFEIYEVEHA